MSELIFTDGKYKDSKVLDIIKSDPGFCHYLYHQSKSYVPKKIKLLLSEYFQDKDDYYMSFGPYKGYRLKDINLEEPEYINFLIEDPYIKLKCTKLYEKLMQLSSIRD